MNVSATADEYGAIEEMGIKYSEFHLHTNTVVRGQLDTAIQHANSCNLTELYTVIVT
jgi:hypothetical protein